MLLVRAGEERGLLPKIRGQVRVGLPQGEEHRLDEVAGGAGVAGRGRVAVGDAGEVGEGGT